MSKVDRARNEIVEYEAEFMDGQFCGRGLWERRSLSAARCQRCPPKKGIPVGYFRPITLSAFPDAELAKMALGTKTVIVPELNCGQMVLEVERLFHGEQSVAFEPCEWRAFQAFGNFKQN